MNYISGGEKYYELKDHLGDVRVVMTDVRDQDKIEPSAITDYYPYGMMMPGRHWEKPEYRYGFNGMERTDYVQENSRANETLNPKTDLSGTGNSYDFGARRYDPRTGIFWSIDPLTQKFPWQSPYVFAGNNPSAFIDKNGEEPSQNQAVSLESYKTKLSKLDCNSLDDLRKIHTYERYGGNFEQDGPMSSQRYLYSSKWGWIDMLHFSAAALDASKNDIKTALKNGEKLEIYQKLYGGASAWDYEDLISNLLGASFSKYNSRNSNDIKTNLYNYLKDLGFGEVNGVKDKLPADQASPGLGTQNYDYSPAYAPDKNNRNSSTDNFVKGVLKNYMKDRKEEMEALENWKEDHRNEKK